jgi:hypothetical protein
VASGGIPLLAKAMATHSDSVQRLKRRAEDLTGTQGTSTPPPSRKKLKNKGSSLLQYFFPKGTRSFVSIDSLVSPVSFPLRSCSSAVENGSFEIARSQTWQLLLVSCY